MVRSSLKRVALVALPLLAAFTLPAQNFNGLLTGIVSDATGAVVPGATVVLKNVASGDLRRSVTNSDGFFSIAAVPPATYTVTIEAKGFKKYELKNVAFSANDKRNLSDITLEVGETTSTVEVTGTVADITPVDSGEKSSVISTQQLQNVAVVGANAAEFIKILPGMALTGGTQTSTGYAGEIAGTNNGPIGSFSANGQRTGAMDITSDGANVIDPGCNCGQAVNVNVDMTQEMKVSTSNFGADAAKGPILIQAVGKSGGRDFHGQGFFYARHAVMNANDALNNSRGLGPDGKMLAPRPNTKYLYPGFTLGGPVLIPGTDFNKKRDKLFFFFGYEYYNQTVDNGIYQSFVPTADMRRGIFSQSSIDALRGAQSIGYQVEGAANTYPNGIIPASAIDRNGQQLINLYPGSNASVQSTGGFNFVNVSTKPQNAYQLRPRVDWSISDNTKVFFSYNRQRDTAYYLDTLWWRPDPTVPYPTRIIAANESDSISANLTHVFSPTLTNELVVTYTYLNLPNSFEDPSKVDRAALGIQFPTLFKNSVPQIPTLTGWGGGFANLIQPSGYQLTGSLYAKKTLPNIANNLSKVWGTHTAKFGFYWQSTTNDQPSSENANGQLIFANWGGNTSGNAYADLLTGRMAQYAERNKDVLFVMNYRQMDFYGQDSWKVTRRLTLDFGLRLSHLGPWRDTRGSGFAVFDRARYSNNPADVNKLTGIVWNQLDTSIPLSGAPSRALFYNPRFGMAWDIFGNGQTVMRGGWGVYRFHDEQNVVAGALGITQGSFGYTTPTAVTFQEIGAIQASFVAPGGVTVLDKNDNRQPTTRSYSFTISQKMPFKSLLEVAYVGNESYHLSNWNNGFGGLNLLPAGTLFRTPGQFTSDNNYAPNADPLRPFRNYQSIKVINHEMFSNYNSLQVSWNKQTGKVNYMVNYTFGKSLGIRGEGGAPTGDPTNLANNYGVLNNDRTHIFNIAYVIELPNAPTSNRLLRGVSHGWQISGISQFQSGANLQGVVSSNFGMSGTIPAGTRLPDGTIIDRNIGLGAVQITGSPDVQAQPRLTCDPRQGRKEGQFINGACFAVPTPGNNGPFVMPYVKGPAFYNNDVSLFKNFNLSESRKLQFRVSAFNVLNHPLRSFQNGDQNLLLAFNERGQLNNNRFGYADWTIGKRIIMLAAKFYF